MYRSLAVIILAAFFCLIGTSQSQAQFSKPVVVMKGIVMTTDAKPATVRLSIHETGDESTADTSDEVSTCAIQEITAGRANSQTGRYLLIMKPGKKYWLHIEGTFIQSLDSLLSTPKTEKPLTIEENFTVNWRQAPTDDASAAKKD